jgi:hypothetical protein
VWTVLECDASINTRARYVKGNLEGLQEIGLPTENLLHLNIKTIKKTEKRMVARKAEKDMEGYFQNDLQHGDWISWRKVVE